MNIINFEKIVLGILFSIVVLTACVDYYVYSDVSDNWVNVIMIVGGYFTVRKVFSYFKNTDYYVNEATKVEEIKDESIQINKDCLI